jgi:hypothetical protein
MSTYTITPSISYDEQGREIVSYDNAYIDDGNYREYVRENFNRDNSWQDDLYYETPDGQIHHRYGDLDGEIYQRYEQDYVDDVDADDFLRYHTDITPEDAATLREICGGDVEYDQMLEWASRQTNQEFMDWFDDVMTSGDIVAMEEAIRDLYEDWSVRRYEDDGQDYVGFNDYDDSYDEDEYAPTEIDVTPDFLQAVGDNYPDYLDATAWAAQFLDEDVISRFDSIIDYGSLADKANAIDQLMELYRTHN